MNSTQRLGPYKLTSGLIGLEAENVAERPEFGRVAVTKEFYHAGHLGEP